MAFSSHGFSSSLGEACGKVDLQHKRTAPFFPPSVAVHGQACRVRHSPGTLESGRLQPRVFPLCGFFFFYPLHGKTRTAMQDNGASLSPLCAGPWTSTQGGVLLVRFSQASYTYVFFPPHGFFPPFLVETCSRAEPQCRRTALFFPRSMLGHS